jgi:hypothetical protein
VSSSWRSRIRADVPAIGANACPERPRHSARQRTSGGALSALPASAQDAISLELVPVHFQDAAGKPRGHAPHGARPASIGVGCSDEVSQDTQPRSQVSGDGTRERPTGPDELRHSSQRSYGRLYSPFTGSSSFLYQAQTRKSKSSRNEKKRALVASEGRKGRKPAGRNGPAGGYSRPVIQQPPRTFVPW